MKRSTRILILLSMFWVCTASASSWFQISTSQELSDQQQAQLQAEAAQMAAQNATNSVSAPTDSAKRVQEWVNIGTAIGSGLAASAKQLGIAANDFAKTPVGKFTVFLIAWHFIGSTILHVAFALLWFVTWVPILIWYYRVTGFRVTITYPDKNQSGFKKKVERIPIQMTEGRAWMAALMFIVSVIGFVLLLLIS